MFGSTVLAVVLGLVFVYFVFSMACSKINEVVSARLQWRADTLEKWLRKSLDGKEGGAAVSVESFKSSSVISSITSEGSKKGVPSYIAPQTFSLAVLDLLAPGDGQVSTLDEVKSALAALPPGHPAKAPLTRLAIEAGDDLARFRRGVEGWFNDSMARVSGWYKRRIQRWMLVYAAALTIFLNVDTLVIARTLWSQDAVRDAVVAQAQGQPGSLEEVSTKVADVRHLGLPIGWAPERRNGAPNPDPRRWPGMDPGGLVTKLLGLGITVGALSLGTPFWFDVLNKIGKLRSTGERPSTATPSDPSPFLNQPVAAAAPVAMVSVGSPQSNGSSELVAANVAVGDRLS